MVGHCQKYVVGYILPIFVSDGGFVLFLKEMSFILL